MKLGLLCVSLVACASSGESASPPGSNGFESGGGGGTLAAPGTGDGGTGAGESAGGAITAEAGTDASGGEAGRSAERHVFSIEFDYRFDTMGFFDAKERRDALAAAAARWSAVLADDFPSVPRGTKLRLNNPENRDETVSIDGIEHDIDDVLVFVGTSEAIPGYGRGGPSSTAETGDPTLDQELADRLTGPKFRPWAGSISFKGSADYFFDPTPDTGDDVPPEQYDFISLATHELAHVLGFSASEAFTAEDAGATFVGPIAEIIYGTAVPLTPDHAHWADGTESDGVVAIMTPSLPNGLRRNLTSLDIAALLDIGYTLKN